jgi:hypothetical protein
MIDHIWTTRRAESKTSNPERLPVLGNFISRPFELGTLQEWGHTVPHGCNVGVSLILYDSHPHAHDHDWVLAYLVAPVAQSIANEFDIPVHYHRTWFGPGNNVTQSKAFHPVTA